MGSHSVTCHPAEVTFRVCACVCSVSTAVKRLILILLPFFLRRHGHNICSTKHASERPILNLVTFLWLFPPIGIARNFRQGVRQSVALK